MLTNTFCHTPRIGLGTERRLWESGLCSWDDLDGFRDAFTNPRRDQALRLHIDRSRRALETHDGSFFTTTMPPSEAWRLYREFTDRVAYIDIETSGPSVVQGSVITTIALYDGRNVHAYVHGDNLAEFKHDIRNYDLIVSYNGKCFDIPFIESYFKTTIHTAHIDLRFVMQSLGYTGGLKGVERTLGMDRGDLDGVDGYMAVLLWREYMERGDATALETLVAYNIEDTVNLEQLMLTAYNLKVKETPFASEMVMSKTFVRPDIGYAADRSTIARVRRRWGLW